jgi:hypothetical protein
MQGIRYHLRQSRNGPLQPSTVHPVRKVTMHYRILADLVVISHFMFIVFVVTGGYMVLYRGGLVIFHLPALIWGSYIEFSGTICPLTPLEKNLDRLADHAGYTGGFIHNTLVPIIYPIGLTREIQVILGMSVIFVNAFAYFLLLRRIWAEKAKSRVI